MGLLLELVNRAKVKPIGTRMVGALVSCVGTHIPTCLPSCKGRLLQLGMLLTPVLREHACTYACHSIKLVTAVQTCSPSPSRTSRLTWAPLRSTRPREQCLTESMLPKAVSERQAVAAQHWVLNSHWVLRSVVVVQQAQLREAC